jgi:hypothetical protein
MSAIAWATSAPKGGCATTLLGMRRSPITPGQMTLGLIEDPRAILGLLTEQLRAQGHRGRLVSEMGLCQGEVRVDLAAIDSELHGFEIKSERDNLRRLPAQAAIYSAVFDRMTIVAAPRHITGAERRIPGWWGVSIVDGEAGAIRPIRPATPNPGGDPLALARLLWRDEAAAFVSARTGRMPTSPRPVLWQQIVDVTSPDELRALVCVCLRNRADWRAAG